MMQFEALVLARDERAVLQTLGRLGAAQLEPASSSNALPLTTAPERDRDLARCDRMLARLAELQKGLSIASALGAPGDSIPLDAAEQSLAEWENRIGHWMKRREQCQRRIAESQALDEQVRLFEGLDLRLDQPDSASFLHFVTGTLPAGKLDSLSLPEAAAVLPLPSSDRRRQTVIAMSTRALASTLDSRLGQAGFEPRPLPVADGRTMAEVCADLETEKEDLQKQLVVIDEEGSQLTATADGPLRTIRHTLLMERRLVEAARLNGHTAATVLITGWIPAQEVSLMERTLHSVTHGQCLIEMREPTDVPEQEIPVLLRSRRWTAPFQTLMTAYGFPRYREVVPTAFIAVSYPLMFGMMFGDVGHGAILALVGIGLLLFAPGRMLAAAVLLLANGLSSTAFGLVYGSYFGIPGLKKHALWQDPLEGDPVHLMTVAIGVGVLLMSAGLLLNITNRLRRREFPAALLDKFGLAGVIFYWGALIALGSGLGQTENWPGWLIGCVLATPIVCWTLREPIEHALRRPTAHGPAPESMSWVALAAESLVGAFEGVLLYLANTVSFVRLAAYAMSHAALLMATFTLADQLRGLPQGGAALGIMAVVLGNIAALVLEGIVAAVQALRLEYYEFFGKFFAGDGRPFKPFSLGAEIVVPP